MRTSRCGSCHNSYTPFSSLLPDAIISVRNVHNPSTPIMQRSILDGMCLFVSCQPNTLELDTPSSIQFPEPKKPIIPQQPSSDPTHPQTCTTRLSLQAKFMKDKARLSQNSVLISDVKTVSNIPIAPVKKEITSSEKVLLLAQTTRSFIRDEVSLLFFKSC